MDVFPPRYGCSCLRVEFFSRVLGNQPADQHPRLIALSVTFLTAHFWLLSNLLTVNFTIDNCVLRGPPSDFSQREIEMKLEVCGKKAAKLSQE
jgi:hypothetical protein